MAKSSNGAEIKDKLSTILVMIRRGESISQISSMLKVTQSDVERVMDWYVNKVLME